MTGFPWHCRDGACERLDRVMREKDGALFTVFNGPLERYEIFRQGAAGAACLVKRLEDERGEFVHPDWMRGYILQRLHEADRPAGEVCREIEEANAAQQERQWRALIDECVAMGQYYRRAIAVEASGMASPYKRDLDGAFARMAAET